MFGSRLGMQNFTIMDTKDSKALVRDILTDRGVEFTSSDVNTIVKKISEYKNNLIKPAMVLADPNEKRIFADVYQEYQNISWRRKSFDFDDLIIYTILLLSSYPDVADWVHRNILYTMADECLTGDTYVDTSIGKIKIKRLYDIYKTNKTLPMIKSFNIESKHYEYKPMTYAHKSNDRQIFEIKTEGLNKLRCTDNHKVLTQRGYIEVKDLIIGKDMLLLDSSFEIYDKKYITDITPIGIEDVYDITVEDNHNFIASSSYYATGIIVHNCQDTNSAQFQLIKLIIGNNNVMMVGDVNQSIYGFRNAKPEYLENFASVHPNTIKLKLEQNYRSTKNIIEAANKVVDKNKFGTKVEMFCANERGSKIQVYEANDVYAEAKWIATEILLSGQDLSDFAIIYRANFQSRVIEEIFTESGIGYTIFGSQSFYSRKEVKDLLAYCKAVLNPNDIDSFKRVLGTLKGVGKQTIGDILDLAEKQCINYHDVLSLYCNTLKPTSAVRRRLDVVDKILNTSYSSVGDIVEDVLFLTEYRSSIAANNNEDSLEKLEIISEFQKMIESMEKDSTDSMADMIDQIALLSDAKGQEKSELNAVKLMTAHASKGLEFNTVFIIGTEEGVFPHANAINANTVSAIEEERRLFYVAMTRAEKRLYITRARVKSAGKDGAMIISHPSRFLNEIPVNLTEDAF